MKGQFTIQIRKNSPFYDHDDVFFMRGEKQVGFGYKGKTSDKICIMRCPQCGCENYGSNIPTGTCAFCGFNANG